MVDVVELVEDDVVGVLEFVLVDEAVGAEEAGSEVAGSSEVASVEVLVVSGVACAVGVAANVVLAG